MKSYEVLLVLSLPSSVHGELTLAAQDISGEPSRTIRSQVSTLVRIEHQWVWILFEVNIFTDPAIWI